MQIAYVLNGATYAYGGMHVAVVGVGAGGTLEARQYIEVFGGSHVQAVSPDGRWLLMGSHSVGSLRSYAIDGAGKLTPARTITILDEPVFIDFKR
jgi:hypothetical protein